MKKITLIDTLITLVLAGIAYWLHLNTFINWDVAWHIEGARRLLQGGDYLTNIFDNNSPFVFSYFFPIIWIKKFFPLSYVKSSISYILATTTFIALVCYQILCFNRNRENSYPRFIYYNLLFILFFLPVANLGQRETIFILFFLPYFLLRVCKTPYPVTNIKTELLYISAAVCAAYAVMQNIFYLCTPLFLDIYHYLKFKNISLYQVVFYACTIFFSLLTLVMYPTYINKIVPFALYYERGFNMPLTSLMSDLPTFIGIIALITLIINFKTWRHSEATKICFIAMLCSFVIYFIEMKNWYYHLYPALSFLVLCLGFIIANVYERNSFSSEKSQSKIIMPSIAVAVLTTLVTLVVVQSSKEFTQFHDPYNAINQWLNYARKHFHDKKLYFFAIRFDPIYSPLFYVNNNIQVVSPWSNAWLLSYLITRKEALKSLPSIEYDNKIFRALAADALAKQRPDFIITERIPWKLIYQGKQFNYLDFFSQNPYFKQLMKQYRFYGQVGANTLYIRNHRE